MKQLRQYLSGNMRQYGMVIALTVITLLFGILTDGNIFNAMNVSNLILQNSYLILLSVGMFFCILTGNVDLSVGSVLAFCGSILGVLIVKCGLNPWLSTILVLALGVTIGVIQGVFIAYPDRRSDVQQRRNRTRRVGVSEKRRLWHSGKAVPGHHRHGLRYCKHQGDQVRRNLHDGL